MGHGWTRGGLPHLAKFHFSRNPSMKASNGSWNGLQTILLIVDYLIETPNLLLYETHTYDSIYES